MRSKPAYDAYDDARKAFADDDYAKARSLVNKSVSIEPREGHFHALLGDIALKQNRNQAAKSYYDRAISNNPNFFYYFVQRGVTNEKLHYNAQAKQDLQKSLDLLPTADAYNSLGNIARAERNPAKAKEYYAKAAENDSEAGQSAYASLVDMDIGSNPSQYVQVKVAQNSSGGIVAQISNPTPRKIGRVVLAISVADTSGRVRQISKALSGTIAAKTKEQINLGINGLTQAQLQTLRVTVTQASVVR
jgi:tetratricopeptide (TPR) repeat protein